MEPRDNQMEQAAQAVQQAGEQLRQAEQTLRGDGGSSGSVAQQFQGLPLGLLLCQPILEVAKGQAALCQVYLDTLFKLAYVDGDPTKGTRYITFDFDRLVIDKETGREDTKTFTLKAPLISLVPLPAFTMDEATVDFQMEVHDQTVDTSNNSSSTGTTDSLSFWGVSASVTGTVSADSSHTRTTDNTAKYTLHARAVQQAPSEGMAKLTSLFAASIEPIEKSSS